MASLTFHVRATLP